jgi:hydrogenase maturation protease
VKVVIGVGNDLRGDDAAGLEVARMLCASGPPPGVRVVERGGDPLALIEAWDHPETEAAIVVDAARFGGAPGTVRSFDAGSMPLPARLGGGSTHALGVGEAIELARSLGKLPPSLVVHAIEGGRFEFGGGLSPSVERTAELLAERLRAELGSSAQPIRSFPQGG